MRPPTNTMDIAQLQEQLLQGDRRALAKAITLAESTRAEDEALAQQLLQKLALHPTQSFRIGITGVPGAGKSTLIDALGYKAIAEGHKVAVLAVDPSSRDAKGSILGDKTRMTRLSKHPHAFIRPSPTAGHLGGIAQKTADAVKLTEAAGFNYLLIETVGVGQSETLVAEMVDCFVLVLITGAGDELQGIKRGIMEMADIICINKAEKENLMASRQLMAQLKTATHLLPEKAHGLPVHVLTCSAVEETGVDDLWKALENFKNHITAGGFLQAQRKSQEALAFDKQLDYQIIRKFREMHGDTIRQLKTAVATGSMTVQQALSQLPNQ